MKTKAPILFLTLSLFLTGAFARGEAPAKVLKYTFKNDEKPTDLHLFGYGIRKKKIPLFWVKIYELQVYADIAAAAAKTMLPIKETLLKPDHLYLRMRFLREVTTAQIQESFTRDLKRLKIAPDQPGFKELLQMLKTNNSFKTDEVLAFEMKKNPKTHFLVVNAKKSDWLAIQTLPTFREELLRFWFSMPVEPQLEKFQKEFVRVNTATDSK